MKNILFISSIFLFACSVNKGVYYDEMNKTLIVRYQNEKLILQTGNSKNHSAYLIHHVKAIADIPNKQIIIKAYETSKKDNKDRFEIDLKKLGVSDVQDYKIIWLDPDGKNINLQLQKGDLIK